MRLLLGVTGGISASLIPGWVLYLRQVRQWDVRVILSESATHFVSPAALEAISGHPVDVGERWMNSGHSLHKELTRDVDAFAISPCTVNTFAKLGAGIADNVITLTAAFATCPVVLFPAFGPTDVGKLWQRMNDDVTTVGYHVTSQYVPAVETADGTVKQEQGFPTIDVFEREVTRVVKTHASP